MAKRTLVALLALALVVGACSGAESEDATTTTPTEDATTTTPAGGATTTTPAGDATTTTEPPPYDETARLRSGLSLAGNSLTGTFDPVASTSVCDAEPWRLIYGTLTFVDPDGSVEPWLIESWTEVDDTTLDLNLHEGMTFSDGTPFDAEAVKAGLDRNRGDESSIAVSLESIESVEVVDPLTVRLSLNAPVAGSILLALSSREGMLPSPAAVAGGNVGEEPVGAGPYVLTRFAADDILSLDRNPSYFRPNEFAFAGIDFIHVDPQSALNALLSGGVDIVALREDSVDPARGGGADASISDSQSYVYVNLNKADGPLSNVDVRKAINLAVDRKTLAEALFLGQGIPTWQIFSPSFFGHDPGLENSYPYDLDGARALLAQAGYPDGFEMSLIFPPAPPFDRLAEAVQAQLAEIGIDVELVRSVDIIQDYHIDSKTDAALTAWIPRPDPAVTFTTKFGPVGVHNVPQDNKYENLELMALAAEAQATTDTNELAAVYQAMSEIVVNEALELGLVFRPVIYGYQTDVGFFSGQLEHFGSTCSGPDYSGIFIER